MWALLLVGCSWFGAREAVPGITLVHTARTEGELEPCG
jgi:hypothetical protein